MRATHIIATIFALSLSANAGPHAPGEGNRGERGGGHEGATCERQNSHCKKANLDENQKAQIKAAKAEYKKQMDGMKAQLKTAYKKFMDVMKDPNANKAAAEAALQDLNAARTQMQKAKQDLKLNILFTIAKPEQRMHLFHCMMEKARHGRGHGHGHGHGHGNDHGDNDGGGSGDDDSGSDDDSGDDNQQPAPQPAPEPVQPVDPVQPAPEPKP